MSDMQNNTQLGFFFFRKEDAEAIIEKVGALCFARGARHASGAGHKALQGGQARGRWSRSSKAVRMAGRAVMTAWPTRAACVSVVGAPHRSHILLPTNKRVRPTSNAMA